MVVDGCVSGHCNTLRQIATSMTVIRCLLVIQQWPLWHECLEFAVNTVCNSLEAVNQQWHCWAATATPDCLHIMIVLVTGQQQQQQIACHKLGNKLCVTVGP